MTSRQEEVSEDRSYAPPPEGVWFDVLRKSGLVRPIENRLVRYTGVSMVTWATRVNRGLEYIPTLLLTTIGRRSGDLHDTALGYYVNEGRVVIIGSVGGAAEHPDWYLNLCDHPLVWLTIQRKRYPCDTYTAAGAERDLLWAYVKARIPEYAAYERRATRNQREMPVVVCQPRRAIPGLSPW
jgi:deazaflavin-dependent oxidoreductase (nitroreductase family)